MSYGVGIIRDAATYGQLVGPMKIEDLGISNSEIYVLHQFLLLIGVFSIFSYTNLLPIFLTLGTCTRGTVVSLCVCVCLLPC